MRLANACRRRAPAHPLALSEAHKRPHEGLAGQRRAWLQGTRTRPPRPRSHVCRAAVMQGIQAMGVPVMAWEDMLRCGRKQPTPKPYPPQPEDLCTIMYTSGTTGVCVCVCVCTIMYTSGTTVVCVHHLVHQWHHRCVCVCDAEMEEWMQASKHAPLPRCIPNIRPAFFLITGYF